MFGLLLKVIASPLILGETMLNKISGFDDEDSGVAQFCDDVGKSVESVVGDTVKEIGGRRR